MILICSKVGLAQLAGDFQIELRQFDCVWNWFLKKQGFLILISCESC